MLSLTKIVISFTISVGADKCHRQGGSFPCPLQQEKITCPPNIKIGTR